MGSQRPYSEIIKMKTENMISPEKAGSRYGVKRVAVFEDSLAYEGKRGIYEITDNKTGKVYFGISGIGITELGSHRAVAGEIIVEDEK